MTWLRLRGRQIALVRVTMEEMSDVRVSASASPLSTRLKLTPTFLKRYSHSCVRQPLVELNRRTRRLHPHLA